MPPFNSSLVPVDRGSFARTVAGMAALRWADMYGGSGDDSESVGFGPWESRAPQQNGDEEKKQTKDKTTSGERGKAAGRGGWAQISCFLTRATPENRTRELWATACGAALSSCVWELGPRARTWSCGLTELRLPRAHHGYVNGWGASVLLQLVAGLHAVLGRGPAMAGSWNRRRGRGAWLAQGRVGPLRGPPVRKLVGARLARRPLRRGLVISYNWS